MDGEARVEDLLVLLPSEGADFVVATTGVPVSGLFGGHMVIWFWLDRRGDSGQI